jgi:hypothetical protein
MTGSMNATAQGGLGDRPDRALQSWTTVPKDVVPSVMRVRLRGFDDCELCLRPARGEQVHGERLELDDRQLDRALRMLPSEVPPLRLRSLLQQTGHRGDVRDERSLIAALRRRIDLGELMFVRRARQTVDARVIEPSLPPVQQAFEPEDIVEGVDWIEILAADENGEPVAGVAYELELPDGSVRRGRTNQFGIARCEPIPSGACKLTLPELDESAWGTMS